MSDADAEEAREGLVEEKRFFILPSELFCNVRARAASDENLNETLERIFRHIEESAKGTSSEGQFAGLFNHAHIHLKGSGKTVKVIFNPDLRSSGRVRKAAPNIIEIGPLALSNETELANTIAHELNHARSFIKGGNAPESKAYFAGNRLEEYMKGMR